MTPSDFEITPSLTRAFWEAMTGHFGTRVFPKRRSPAMHLAGGALHAARVMDFERFMGHYTTVWANRIYPWFEIGEGDASDLWSQIVVCVHEHQHVVQYRREGFIPYAYRYLRSSRLRARYEAEAYTCNLEMAWWRRRRVPPVEPVAQTLLEYGCSEEDAEEARRILEAAVDSIVERGEVSNEATRVALAFFEDSIR